MARFIFLLILSIVFSQVYAQSASVNSSSKTYSQTKKKTSGIKTPKSTTTLTSGAFAEAGKWCCKDCKNIAGGTTCTGCSQKSDYFKCAAGTLMLDCLGNSIAEAGGGGVTCKD